MTILSLHCFELAGCVSSLGRSALWCWRRGKKRRKCWKSGKQRFSLKKSTFLGAQKRNWVVWAKSYNVLSVRRCVRVSNGDVMQCVKCVEAVKVRKKRFTQALAAFYTNQANMQKVVKKKCVVCVRCDAKLREQKYATAFECCYNYYCYYYYKRPPWESE